MTALQHYLENAIHEFTQIKTLGDKSFHQISDAEFYYQPDAESNSIAIIIQHMEGNMISRWTDFLTTDGEKPTRRRDEEFEAQSIGGAALIQQWETGWKVLFDTLNSLTASDLMKEVAIRGEKHTVIQAINRQLTHYAYHVGQIVYIAKHLRSLDWNTLSMPKNRK